MKSSTRQAMKLTQLVLNGYAPSWMYQLANDIFYEVLTPHYLQGLWKEVSHYTEIEQFNNLICIELKCSICKGITFKANHLKNPVCNKCAFENRKKRALKYKYKKQLIKLSPFYL